MKSPIFNSRIFHSPIFGEVAGAAPSFPLLDSLTSYWSLEEASGTRVDAHGDNDLTDNNTVTSATGKVGNAADFEANNSEYLSDADNTSYPSGNNDMTICGWINLESLGTARRGFGQWDFGNAQRGWFVQWLDAADRFMFSVSSNGTLQTHVVATTVDPTPTGTWFFVVAWHDATNDLIYIQVNNGTPQSAAHSTGIHDSTAAFSIGVMHNNTVAESDASLIMDGLIDEVGLWSRVLTAAERTFLYNAGNGRSYADVAAYTG